MRLLFSLLLSLFLYTGINGQQANSDQWTLFTKKTAEWCPRCGSWGWEMMEGAIERLEGDRVIIAALHYSGDLQNQVSSDISSNFGGTYQPVFYINQTDINVLSSNVDQKLDEAEMTIETLNALPATAGVAIDAVLRSDGHLDVKGEIEFFELTNGEFYLAIYEIQDNFPYSQAGYDGEANHKKLLRQSLQGGSFGELIGSGDIQAGTSIPIDISIPYSPPIQGNIEIAAVLWKKNSTNQFEFCNGFLDRTPDLTASVSELDQQDKIVVFYNGRDHVVHVQNSAELFNSHFEIKLFNSTGHLMYSHLIESGVLDHEIYLELPDLSNGVYILLFGDENQQYSKKLSIIR